MIGFVEKLSPENRDVPMHLPRSQEVLPFGITNKESLAERPTDREDLMRPTSSSIPSHENEKREGTDQQPQRTTATSPRDAKEWASHRALKAASLGSLGEISSASTDVTISSEGDIERYSAAHVKIPADDLEVIVHDTQVLFLENLSAAVEDIECSEQLQTALDSANEGHAGDRVSGREISGSPFSSAAMYQSDREALSWYHELEVPKPASAAAAHASATPSSSNKAPAYRPIDDEWESGAAIGFAKPVDLDMFLRNRRGEEYAGHGYGLLSSQFLASRQSAGQAKARIKAVQLPSGSRRRELQRELRNVAGTPQYLGFEAFKSFLEAKSYVLTEDVYSAIDSGTTVSISADGKLLMNGFDPKTAVKIMGFNGSISKSAGSGDLVGFAYSRDGRRIPLRVQRVHSVLGAPNDLLSVSALLQQGYQFHFTKEKSWIVTPEMDTLNLIEKGGLFWLKWQKAIDPSTQHADYEKYCAGVAARERAAAEASTEQVEAMAASVEDDVDRVDSESYLNSFSAQGQNVRNPSDCESCCAPSCHSCGGAKSNSVSLQLVHQRLGHFSSEMLEKMSDAHAFDVTLSDRTKCECAICKANKLTRGSVPCEREQSRPAPKPFERVCTDVKGQLTPDFWGNVYMVTFTCELTRWSMVYFCKQKSQVKDRFKEYLETVKRMGYVVKLLQSDGGGEYAANENAQVLSDFQKICLAERIEHHLTAPHTPAQNGVSERLNRTLVEHAACIIHAAGLAREFWSLAVKHIVWVRNRLWHRSLNGPNGSGLSPFQALHGRPPVVSTARVWGCDAWRLDHTRDSASFAPKGKKSIFVGLAPNRKGWVLFDPRTRKMRTTYHCAFDESLHERRCGLLDYTLRPRKAGPGATRDEERIARLEGELYDPDGNFVDDIIDDKEAGFRVMAKPVRRQQQSHQLNEAQKVERQSPELSFKPGNIGQSGHDPSLDVAREEEAANSDLESSNENGADPESAPLGGPGSGGSLPTPPPIPQRRAAIGAIQELSEDDVKFLEFAFVHDMPIQLQGKNPKQSGSASRLRYEKYKSATTLREVKHRGGTWKDILWDFSRGYIDFRHISGAAGMAELMRRKIDSGIAQSPASFVDQSGNVVTAHHFGSMSLVESLQHDYALAAIEHIEGLPHRVQRQLQTALGETTLTQFAHCCASRILINEPLTVAEAQASEHAAEWRAAMDEEIANLNHFGCFQKVPRSEALKHGRLVKSKWVFKVKYNDDNTVQRFRARLVAEGFTQVPGSDFYETYSPVFSYTSLRTIFAVAAERNLQLDQWDLKNSFIQQKLDVEHMYMECPDGYPKTMEGGEPAAMHCRQSIYGLKQSSRLLHQRLSKFLRASGFKQLVSDQCVYIKGTGNDQVIVCCWVDDIILASSRDNHAARSWFDTSLRTEFEVSPWTPGVEASWILNMKVQRNWERGTLHLSQPGAIEKLAAQFKLTEHVGRGPHVPMDPLLKLEKTEADKIVPPSSWDYQSAVGAMLYLSLTARPDIAQCVGVLSRFMSCPGEQHVTAAKQAIKYLYATKDLGITYTKGLHGAPHVFMRGEPGDKVDSESPVNGHEFVTYADADLAGDVGTRKSTTGFVVVLAGGLVSWMSKLQSTVALSTAEAETNASVEAVKQIMHFRLFMRELGMGQDGPSVVYEDNQAAIAIAQKEEQSRRSKHYMIKAAFLADSYKRGIFRYAKVGTKEQLADAFTKALPRDDFNKFREWMGVKAF